MQCVDRPEVLEVCLDVWTDRTGPSGEDACPNSCRAPVRRRLEAQGPPGASADGLGLEKVSCVNPPDQLDLTCSARPVCCRGPGAPGPRGPGPDRPPASSQE